MLHLVIEGRQRRQIGLPKPDPRDQIAVHQAPLILVHLGPFEYVCGDGARRLVKAGFTAQLHRHNRPSASGLLSM